MRRIAFAIVVCLTPVLLAQTGVGYHITRTYDLGGDGGWDYIVPVPSSRASKGRTAPPLPNRAVTASPHRATINRS